MIRILSTGFEKRCDQTLKYETFEKNPFHSPRPRLGATSRRSDYFVVSDDWDVASGSKSGIFGLI